MRKKSGALFVLGLGFIAIAGLALFVYFSPMFEREAPKVSIPQTIYWNLKSPLQIPISDNHSIGKYSVELNDGGKITPLAEATANGQKGVTLNLMYPKNGMTPSSKEPKIVVKVSDNSFWNFFMPNSTTIESKLICDTTPPTLSVVSSSYSISKGGSAVVVFEAKDAGLKEAYVKTASGKIFKAQPFVKNGFYVCVIGWGLKEQNFSASVAASDKAGNTASVQIPFYLKDVAYKQSRLELKDDFLNQKITELSSGMKGVQNAAGLDKFMYVNNTLRGENEKLIAEITSRIDDNVASSFFTEPFLPIKNASVVGSFGDFRSFYIGDKLVSESYHKGIDFASLKEASIVAPNKGVTVYAGNNGIYGNTVILYHGMGLFTLYSHCSSFAVKVGDVVERGKEIAKTGTSGLAFGDHLHYGVIAQGVEVRPVEWLDSNWIKLNVTEVLASARSIIASRQ